MDKQKAQIEKDIILIESYIVSTEHLIKALTFEINSLEKLLEIEANDETQEKITHLSSQRDIQDHPSQGDHDSLGDKA